MKNKIVSLAPLLVALAAFAAVLPTQSNAQNIPSSVDQAPKALSQPLPAYSYELRHDEIQGTVVVSFTITASGQVADAEIVSTSDRRLDRPTLLAVSQWRYAPAIKAGMPVSTRVLQTVSFKMPDSA
jgi:protein TonB